MDVGKKCRGVVGVRAVLEGMQGVSFYLILQFVLYGCWIGFIIAMYIN